MKFSAALVCAAFALFSASVEALPYRRGDVTVFSDCTQDSDCQQGCCSFNTGKCAGPGIAQTNGDGGCGFGESKPNCDVATVLNLGVCVAGARAAESNPGVIAAAKFTSQLDSIPFPEGANNDSNGGDSGKKHKHKASSERDSDSSSSSSSSSSGDQSSKLTVFESCTSDSDCQQGCCSFSTGKCAGPVVAQTNGDGGCGFGGSAPNCNVATLLGFDGSCIAGSVNDDLSDPTIIAAARFTSNLDGIPFDQ